jgi:hypothetical protein
MVLSTVVWPTGIGMIRLGRAGVADPKNSEKRPETLLDAKTLDR